MPAERTILVTGAGGFIGGRITEALLQSDGFHVRAGIRRWASAARIGRYPIRPVMCDLMARSQIRGALEGVDGVIHSAVGSRDVTVQGTRNLLEAALEAGVPRVVHLSTIDVYGRAEGGVDEEAPRVRTEREYGDSKIEAEEVCEELAARGLEVVMLRPTIVYGPHSDLWTVEPAQRLVEGSWEVPPEACQGTCNLVYVDDLVRATILALDAPDVSGAAFNINGPDRVTWQDYFDALANQLGVGEVRTPSARASRVRTRVVDPVRSLVKAVYFRFEDSIMGVYQRSRTARRLMKWLQGALLRVPSAAEYDLYGRDVHFPTDLAEARLGYRPRVDMEAGVAHSRDWLVHEGVVGSRG